MAKTPVIRIPRPRPSISEIELCAWVAQAAPGAVLEYHRGYLALDRTGAAVENRPWFEGTWPRMWGALTTLRA